MPISLNPTFVNSWNTMQDMLSMASPVLAPATALDKYVFDGNILRNVVSPLGYMAGYAIDDVSFGGLDNPFKSLNGSLYNPLSVSVPSPSSGFSGVSSSPPQLPQYIDAPLAEKYGMSPETAYQEALSNTAYQRKVQDLKRAGLNPVLGVQGSGSAVFSGSSMNSASGSGGGSGSSNSSLLSGVPLIVDGVVSLALGANAGRAAGNVAKGLVNSGVLDKLLG